MHIVIDARIINSSTGRYVERLLTYLEKIDTERTYTILVPTKDLMFWRPTNPRFTLRACDVKNYSFAEQLVLKRQLDALQPDLVHFCMPQQPLLYRGKTVTTFHDLNLLHAYNSDKNWFVYHTKQAIGRLVFYFIAHKTNHIITPSQYTKDDVVRFSRVSPENISVTYESADISPTTPAEYQLPFKQYLLYVGQQPDYKNIRRLGDAHQKLLEKYPGLGLVLVGRLKNDALNNKAYFDKKSYRNIHFTDFVPDEQRDWLFKHAEVYCFPSLMEGFGLPPLEAMGHGTPVIASNTTCIPEILGEAALYFNPLSTDEIATTIDSMLTNKKLRASLIKRGYAQLSRYSWERMAQQTHKIYLQILGEKTAR
jgi:glycosyltransferase involved in cell wall biosynthesis